jgi:beta-hydroxylase
VTQIGVLARRGIKKLGGWSQVVFRRFLPKYGFMTAINRWVSHHIVKASAIQNVDGEHVGVLNKAFDGLYEIHLASRRVKQWNRKVYYALKYPLAALVLGLIIASAL